MYCMLQLFTEYEKHCNINNINTWQQWLSGNDMEFSWEGGIYDCKVYSIYSKLEVISYYGGNPEGFEI